MVARYHWANPHVYIDVAVAGEADDEVWEVEAAWPASLVPYGWSRETLKVGDRVEVTGNPGRNAAKRIMLGRSLQTAGAYPFCLYEPHDANAKQACYRAGAAQRTWRCRK